MPAESIVAAQERTEAAKPTLAESLRGGGRKLVATLGGRIVGYAAYGHASGDAEGERTGELTTLFVAPGSWRRGAGSALVRAVASDLSSEGCEELTVWSFRANERANAFYKRQGFETDGAERHQERYANAPEVRMRRSLGGPPKRRLAPEARLVWGLSGLLSLVPAGIAAGWLASLVDDLDVPGWLPWIAFVLYAALAVAVLPMLRWRRWRWEIRADEVEIQHGSFKVTRTLIPIRRIQHVDTESGVLQQTLALATVTLHTAAGKNEIPQLKEGEATRVRDRIAELTRERDEL